MKRRKVNLAKNMRGLLDAQERGLLVVLSEPTLLLFDCDSIEAFNTVRSNLCWAQRLLGIEKAWYTRSQSGNWHVYARLSEPLPQLDRVLLQGALGGDPRRALLDWSRTEQGAGPEASVLFEHPDRVGDAAEPIDLDGGYEHVDCYGG